MREITCSTITDAIKKMCIEAATILPQDVEKALSQKHDEEDSALAQKTLQVLMDNAKLAQEKQMPICQDTGMAFVYVTMGQEVHITGGSLNEAIQEGVRQGYTEGYLRKSVVKDPLFERTNTKDNTPAIIYYDIVEGDTFHITLAPKGFGSENMRELERVVMLKVVDQKWMDHIDDMDELKNGIGLRAYGQKDPVVQYRLEGADMFDDMIEALKDDVAKIMLNIQKKEENVKRTETAEITGAGLEDTAINLVDGTVKPKEGGLNKTVVNTEPKVGRNDPCPCGSGKKYKNCCGKNQ